MKIQQLKTYLAIAAAVVLGHTAHAANAPYQLYADYNIFLPTTANGSNQVGRLFIGNFSGLTAGTLLSNELINTTYNPNNDRATALSLLSLFRPATSWAISGGALVGDTGNGLSGNINVGNAVQNDDPYTVAAGQFAAQPAYLLALSVSDSDWNTALANWQTDAGNSLILLSAIDSFGAGNDGDPRSDFGLDPFSGTVIAGVANTSTYTITGVAIPEPASGSLFLLGAAGVFALRRLRKTNV